MARSHPGLRTQSLHGFIDPVLPGPCDQSRLITNSDAHPRYNETPDCPYYDTEQPDAVGPPGKNFKKGYLCGQQEPRHSSPPSNSTVDLHAFHTAHSPPEVVENYANS
ncbi:hypothetical protein Q8A73_004341 [Channa argus]|nr:hypothetical protein Q8A73_004341 [Channa argus]